MTKLKYKWTNDILFKLTFLKYPDLLQRLIAALLEITYESIQKFEITNQEIPPEEIGKKFCRLDINMIVDDRHCNLEVQVENDGAYPDRSLYYWAREFSLALNEGQDYAELPQTIVISILGFNQFADPNKFHSEFGVLEMTSHEPLSDKFKLHYFELPKLPNAIDASNMRDLWLKLFKAETEEELTNIDALGVSTMSEAVRAYRQVAASPEFRELERMRSKRRHDEAQALKNAELRGELRGEERAHTKWQGVVAEKDAEIALLREQLDNRQ